MDLAWQPGRNALCTLGASGRVYLWASIYKEDWNAFAPDYTTLDCNQVGAVLQQGWCDCESLLLSVLSEASDVPAVCWPAYGTASVCWKCCLRLGIGLLSAGQL